MNHRKGRFLTLLLVAALTALGLMTLGGAPAGADTAAALHPLTVTAHTSGHCDWAVTKTADHAHLLLAQDQSFTLNYTVNVTRTCTNTVDGTISGAGNPTNTTVTVGGTTGTVSGCTHDAANDTFSCNYAGHPSSTADGTAAASATYADSTAANGSTPYSFSGVTPDENSVDVFDSYTGAGNNGTLAVHLDHSQSFQYTRGISFHDCGHYTVDNTARVVDGSELAHATNSVSVDVACHPTGCTLTQGYWKTHSKYGPAKKADAAWNLLPGGLGPDTTFFSSGQTWIQVFNTTPSGGNVYYILAHQYQAAVLNQLNGASSTTAVDAALAGAKNFFNTYTPAQAGALAKTSSTRQQANDWATTLDNYNSGLTGPGHCDE